MHSSALEEGEISLYVNLIYNRQNQNVLACILIKILSYHYVNLNNFMICKQKFLIFCKMFFMLLTNAFHINK